MSIFRHLRDIPAILRKVITMSLQLDTLTNDITALEAAVGRAVPDLGKIPQLEASLKAAQDALATSQAAEQTAQQQVDALTARVAALTAQLPPAPAA